MPSFADSNDDAVPKNNTIEKDVIEDDWSQIMTTDLSAGSFAQHDTKLIHLPNNERTSLKISSTESLSPLDMMDLSWGTHDATGHCIWLGAELWIQALPALESYFSISGVCRCLELGSGTGLAGIAVFKYYESSSSPTVFDLVLTDNSESALKLCRLNCHQNGLDETKDDRLHSFEVEQLEWGNALVMSSGTTRVFDVVLATDVIYDIDAWKPLLVTARKSLPPNGGGHLLVSHLPRAALPSNEEVDDAGSTSNIQQSYHKTLESYLIRIAKEQGFRLKDTLKPNDIRPPFEKQQDMEDAGASIMIFERCSTNNL
jgi:SAM-dependent methyltransferase